MKNKKGIEFSFAWIFSLIVGAVILFLAIYAAIRLVGSERNVQQTETGGQLGVILSPVETDLETGKITSITFPTNTRIYDGCDAVGNFGQQKISIASESGIGTKWQDPSTTSIYYNKYIFSDDISEGKSFFVFAKPFSMPYKTADLIFLWPEDRKYCFVDSPNNIKDDITGLNIESINLTDDLNKCPNNSTSVCFSSSDCDINVNLNSKSVSRKGQSTVYYDDSFDDSLLYGAIFSNSALYECQISRLMKRTSELATLYIQKSSFLSVKGCGSSILQADLNSLANQTINVNSSIQITGIAFNANNIKGENDGLLCKLF